MSTTTSAHATPPIALQLARVLAGITLDQASAAAKKAATWGLIDTVGVALLGATEPAVAVLKHTLDGQLAPGGALLLGGRTRAGVLDAALVNGTAAHAADYDDMARMMGGHPSVPLVPVVLALGEALDVSGAQALEAYMVGFEAECRIGRVVNPHHYEQGWHPTATLGVFGAAAAAARLMGLDVAQTANALCIAASMASGIKANFGTMVKPFHVGHCARNGLFAAQLAAKGFTSNPLALEHPQGFFASYDGLANVHTERMLAHAGTRLEVEQPSVGLKQFPCCGSTHPAIRAMLALVRDGLTAADVVSIEVQTNRRRLPHTHNPDPQSGLAAKFSIQYVTARALASGTVQLQNFEGSAHRDPQVRALMALTSVIAYPTVANEDPNDNGNEFAADIAVTTHDGRVLHSSAPHALGRGGEDAMTEPEMWEKYSDCAGRLLPADQVSSSFAMLRAIENCTSLRQFTRLLETGNATEA